MYNKRRRWWWPKLNKQTLTWLGSLLLLGAALIVVFVLYLAKDIPSLSQIENRQVPQSTKIFDREGKTLLYEISAGQKRTVVPLADIPQSLKDATISIEDENFYTQPGFDWQAIVRAIFANLQSGSYVQGGSGITQQLVKNAFLTPDKKISRKIKELLLAVRLDKFYSKDKILELYLNEIPYGPTAYGVESASQAYFNKSIKKITVAEAALLAAVPKAPSYYSPWGSHQKELFNRQRVVLNKMRSLGKITKEELVAALSETVEISTPTQGIKAPHFVMMVQDYLVGKYGEEQVRKGGLKVVTTLNWKLQEIAEKAVKDGVENNRKLYKGKNGALLAQDPKTGQILAMVGSYDYFEKGEDGNFNAAVQGLRQPGSALKPFVYMTAFERGYAPETVLFDVPTNFDATGVLSLAYAPENYDGVFRGPVSLRQGLAQSINIPAVKVLYLAGMENVLRNTYAFGLTTLTDPARYGLSLVLGGGEVRLADLVQAYSVLAQEGTKHSQAFILEVKDSASNQLEVYKDVNKEVIDPQYTRLTTDILSDVSARADLFHSSLNLTVFPGYDVAMKTGTSNDYHDAWTVGYTPSLVAGVWAGNNNNAPMQKSGSSILAAVPIWNAFMKEALKEFSPETFTRPDPVIVEKPVLKGQYIVDNQIHSILYYVDRKDPNGLAPANPMSDSQFINWETGIQGWFTKNLPTGTFLLGSSTLPVTNTTTP